MYSRMPHTPRWSGGDGRREPSYRRSSGLPPNYSGTAFRTIEATADAAMSEELPRRPEDDTTPRFEGLPTVSRLHTPDATTANVEGDGAGANEHRESSRGGNDQALPVSAARPSGLFSLFDNRHFPFGHGIGYEEMLLLGLIFFLSKECDGEGDLNETLILLGLLLLGG